MKKLLIVSDSCFSRKDGIVRFISELIPLLRKTYDIHLIVPESAQREQMLGISVHCCPIYRHISDFAMARPNFAMIKSEVSAADIVWIQSYGPLGLVANHYAQLYHVPVYYYTHIVEWQIAESIAQNICGGKIWVWCARALARYYYHQAQCIMTPSKKVLHEIASMVDLSKIEIVPAGINHQQFSSTARKKERSIERTKEDTEKKNSAQRKLHEEPSNNTTQLTIGYVGRIAREKNLPLLKEAFDRVRQENPRLRDQIRLLIVGDGPEEEKELIRGSGVEITGFVNNVEDYLAQMDLFVLTSVTETSSLATMEAMACGLPIIATRIGYVQEYIEDGFNGSFFEQGNSAELARKIERLLLNRRLREKLGNNAARTARNAPSWKEVADQIADIFEKG